MKKILLIIFVFISVYAKSQTVDNIRKDTIKHRAKGNVTRKYHGTNSYEFETNKNSFNFNKNITVNGSPIGGGGVTQPFDSLTLNPNIPFLQGSLEPYSFYADSTTKTVIITDDGGSISYVNATIAFPFINTLPDTLFPCTAISGEMIDVSSGRGLLDVRVTDRDTLDLAQTYIGLVKDTTPPNRIGIANQLNFQFNCNTSMWSLGDRLYVVRGDSLTNEPAMPPSYNLFVGRVLSVDATEGVIGVNAIPFNGNDTETNIQGILNGIVTQKPSINDTIYAGGDLFFYTTNDENPLIDLPFISNMSRDNLNTLTNTGPNGAAQVQLTYGTATNAQTNYIYIDVTSTPTLAVSTISFPDNGIRIAECAVFDQATHEVNGFAYFQRFNNAVDGSEADGWISKASKRIRLSGSVWESGITPSVTLTTVGGSIDSLDVSNNSGIVWQFNRQSADATNGTRYLWVNSPTGEQWITDLNQIDVDAQGNSLRQDDEGYVITGIYIQNSGDFGDYIQLYAPNGSYTVGGFFGSTQEDVVLDVDNTAVTNVTSKYSKVAVRHFRIPLEYEVTGGGTLINLADAVLGEDYIDDRGQVLGSAGGASGGTSPNTTFTDAEFGIFNSADATKQATFDASQISTGQLRTYTFPNNDGILATLTNIDSTLEAQNADIVKTINIGTSSYISEDSVSVGKGFEGLKYDPDKSIGISVDSAGASSGVSASVIPDLIETSILAFRGLNDGSFILATPDSLIISYVDPVNGATTLVIKDDTTHADGTEGSTPVIFKVKEIYDENGRVTGGGGSLPCATCESNILRVDAVLLDSLLVINQAKDDTATLRELIEGSVGSSPYYEKTLLNQTFVDSIRLNWGRTVYNDYVVSANIAPKFVVDSAIDGNVATINLIGNGFALYDSNYTNLGLVFDGAPGINNIGIFEYQSGRVYLNIFDQYLDDNTPPTLLSGEIGNINDSTVVFTFNEEVNIDAVGWTIEANSVSQTISSVTNSGGTNPRFILSAPLANTDVIEATYDGLGNTEDLNGNDLAALTDSSITNNIGTANIPANPTVYLPMTGNANDQSGNGYDGVTTATLTTDRFGSANSAYLFNGIDDTLSLTNSGIIPILTSQNVGSVSLWLEPVDATPSAISMMFSASQQSTALSFDITNRTDGLLRYRTSDGVNQTQVSTTITISDATWHNFIVTSDGVTTTLYLDGVDVTGTLIGIDGLWFNDIPLDNCFLGARWLNNAAFPSSYFNGKLDDFLIYPRVLNASEISQLANDKP